ncbi:MULTISPECIES: methyl-accepting chemotaxis protein [Clostridium]|uniref:methyl-accepting chemotaxis protein n=1 Tax=Clostridium TaxID=1485 RepID=UPI0008248F52|nr:MULTISPECIES: methyl-accepting chemotaxis protein [Clostridium]PJI10561.1 hypothetical protein CUB90_00790 [Clostridium sp. CT7]
MALKNESVSNENGIKANSSQAQVASEKLNKIKSCNQQTILDVNNLLQFMTNLDYVKDMLHDASEQASMIESVASSSEELATSTEDISNFVQTSSTTTNEAIKETDDSLKNINNTFDELEDNINEINVIKTTMLDVTEETKKINSLIGVIKSVANKTNMLSLNASIEAARAGEHGKGFAVVANEIKKLAENTKEQVSSIESIVSGLNEKIFNTSSEIDLVIDKFSTSKDSINNASSGIKSITSAMNTVGDSFTSISANIEEQTATTQEMSSNLQFINEKSTRIREETNRTGKSFFDISLKIDEIRLRTLANSEEVDNDTMIELSITDHLMWKWRVYNLILGYIKFETSNVGDSHSCRLGKWLDTLDYNNPDTKCIIDNIKEPHSNIHNLAKQAVTEYNAGNIKACENILEEIDKDSKIVINCLNELKVKMK